ncbi:hypothetical protein ACUXWE_001536, partial [Campylobacter jejuni]
KADKKHEAKTHKKTKEQTPAQ